MSKRALMLGVFAVMALAFYVSGTAATSASGPAPKNVTFTKDIAPIFNRECVQCHRPNDLAPMSLVSYKDVRPWARSIREKVASRTMPPWHADPHHGEFANDRRLTQNEVDTIVAWVDQGAKEGDPKDLPPVPEMVEGWHIGKPDVVFTMPEEFTFAESGPDEYRYFKIPTNFKEDMWVQAAEAQPGNKKIVHHIIAFVAKPRPTHKHDAPKAAIPAGFIEAFQKQIVFYEDGHLQRVKADAPVIDDGCSSPNGGQGILRGDKGKDEEGFFLCGMSPGRDADAWAPGTAKKIPAGSTIVLQIHYSRSGNVEKDRSRVGLVFAKTQPDKMVNTKTVSNYHFQIPAGDPNHEVTSCFTLKEDAHITSLMPHMHVRGKDMKITAYYPDGKSEVLLLVPNYSFSWQTNYYLKQAKAAPKGTRIECVAHFDNSAKNKYNPDATKAVRFGDPTYDEMMIGFVEYTLDGQHLAKPDVAKTASGKD
ncbi:MAG TPA: thiol-disulfide isomerase [Blastocatellia bacterium]|nr:thiol-disulfide isomerase [Blastocatellia bacterium]